MTLTNMEGKNAVITGGASGIGLGLARAIVAAGGRVLLADIEGAKAASAAKELGNQSLSHAVDVMDDASINTLADFAFAEMGEVHLLANNAGVGLMRPLTKSRMDDYEWIFGVNMRAIVSGVRHFAPRMMEQEGPAHVLNTGSEHSLGLPFPGMGLYTASKHAVLGYSDVLRAELAEHDIGVSVLCPAVVNTEVWNATRNRPDDLGGARQAPEAAAEFMRKGMSADEVGKIALEGVLRNEFIITTHPQVRDLADARARAVTQAFDILDQSQTP
ncbi:MAG: SDR family NAD(P)-dependent oxidoreductase [Alphaproteobacteria bacterium]